MLESDKKIEERSIKNILTEILRRIDRGFDFK